MNIVRVEYRFLRLSTNLLALVELLPGCNIPQPTTCLYPYEPYLTDGRKSVVSIFEDFDEWVDDQKLALYLAVEEAKRKPVIEFSRASSDTRLRKCTNSEYREICLWVYCDPLIYWDEYCPLFDNEFNYVLR